MFLELFREYNNDAMIMAHLLDWSAIQISSFIDVISRQVRIIVLACILRLHDNHKQ